MHMSLTMVLCNECTQVGRTAMQYAANEATAAYLEKALRSVKTYRDVYEINMQARAWGLYLPTMPRN